MKTYINEVANEAAKILKDYPHLKYYEALIEAKKIIKEKSPQGPPSQESN